MLCACATNTAKSADIAVSGEIAVGQSTESDAGEETVTEMKVTNETEVAEREDEVMHNGLEDYLLHILNTKFYNGLDGNGGVVNLQTV